MKQIFYDANNKTVLTPNEQKIVIKVLIISKVFLLFALDNCFAAKLKTRHDFTNIHQQKLFETIKDKLQENEQADTLSGNQYTLVSDKIFKTFTIYRTENNIPLVQSTRKGYTIKLVNGLTQQDVKQWETIGNILQINHEDYILR